MSIIAREQQIFNLRHPEQTSFARPPIPFQAIAATNIQLGQGDIVATCDAKIGGILVRQVAVCRDGDQNNYVRFPDTVELTSQTLGAAVRDMILAAVAEAMT